MAAKNEGKRLEELKKRQEYSQVNATQVPRPPKRHQNLPASSRSYNKSMLGQQQRQPQEAGRCYQCGRTVIMPGTARAESQRAQVKCKLSTEQDPRRSSPRPLTSPSLHPKTSSSPQSQKMKLVRFGRSGSKIREATPCVPVLRSKESQHMGLLTVGLTSQSLVAVYSKKLPQSLSCARGSSNRLIRLHATMTVTRSPRMAVWTWSSPSKTKRCAHPYTSNWMQKTNCYSPKECTANWKSLPTIPMWKSGEEKIQKRMGQLQRNLSQRLRPESPQ